MQARMPHSNCQTNPDTLTTRKAAGAYFTPEPVVRYIVRHTLDPLLPTAHPDRPLRILEPACGQGVFLIEAYRYLLSWYVEQYIKRGVKRYTTGKSARLERTASGQWRLTIRERERILLSSLFGVDQDPRAVETTKLALALAAARDDPENAKSLTVELARNVRCGDALIDGDSSTGKGGGRSANPFSWKAAFRDILVPEDGGFDGIIGNPPYVNIRVLTRSSGDAVKDYLKRHYRCANGAYDLYVLFLEKAFHLLRNGGMCGLIIPNKIATLDYAQSCRSLLIERTTLQRITDVSQCRVFPDAGVYPYIIIWKKSRSNSRHRVAVFHAESTDQLAHHRPTRYVRQAELSAESGLSIHGRLDVESRVTTRSLGDIADLHSGTTGFNAAIIAADLQEEATFVGGRGFEFIVSGNIDRYTIRLGNVRFMKRNYARPVLPFDSTNMTNSKREVFRSPKIVIAGMARRLETAFDPGGLALGVQVYAAVKPSEDAHYLLALLNSKLLSYLFRIRFQAKQLSGGYLAINKGQLEKLPIRIANPKDQADGRRRLRLVDLAQTMQDLSLKLSATDPVTTAAQDIESELQCLDGEIDRLVYQLYRLTDEEIDQVESVFSSIPTLTVRKRKRLSVAQSPHSRNTPC